MAVPFENRNFHKEMLKLAGQLQKEGKVPRLLLLQFKNYHNSLRKTRTVMYLISM